MPFQETCVLAERISVLKDYDTGVFTVAGLLRRYGVSRETIYVWKRRPNGRPTSKAISARVMADAVIR